LCSTAALYLIWLSGLQYTLVYCDLGIAILVWQIVGRFSSPGVYCIKSGSSCCAQKIGHSLVCVPKSQKIKKQNVLFSSHVDAVLRQPLCTCRCLGTTLSTWFSIIDTINSSIGSAEAWSSSACSLQRAADLGNRQTLHLLDTDPCTLHALQSGRALNSHQLCSLITMAQASRNAATRASLQSTCKATEIVATGAKQDYVTTVDLSKSGNVIRMPLLLRSTVVT
jgi:hypothetical protein